MAAEAHRGEAIYRRLQDVQQIRATQAATPGRAAQVQALKAYQQSRFRNCYADLLQSPRFGGAARFFLEELYGPGDFSRRDAQFVRVVPALVRLFPDSVVSTVDCLAELHALSETLDDEMARQLQDRPLDPRAYITAWARVEQASRRQDQLRLALGVGRRLDELTRSRMLRQSLHWMRGPSKAAGLADLQQFLERGFDTFAAMKGGADFLAIIEDRENQFLAAMNGLARDPSGEAWTQLPALRSLPAN